MKQILAIALTIMMVASLGVVGVAGAAHDSAEEGHSIVVSEGDNPTTALALAGGVASDNSQVVWGGDSDSVYRPGATTSMKFSNESVVTGTGDGAVYDGMVSFDQTSGVYNERADSLTNMSIELVDSYNEDTNNIELVSSDEALVASSMDENSVAIWVTSEDIGSVDTFVGQELGESATVSYGPEVLNEVNESDVENVDWQASSEMTDPIESKNVETPDHTWVVDDVDAAAAVVELVGPNENLQVSPNASDVTGSTTAFLKNGNEDSPWDTEYTYSSQEVLASMTAHLANEEYSDSVDERTALPVVADGDQTNEIVSATIVNVGAFSASETNVTIQQDRATEVTSNDVSNIETTHSDGEMIITIQDTLSSGDSVEIEWEQAPGSQDPVVSDFTQSGGGSSDATFTGFSIAQWGDAIFDVVEDVRGSLNIFTISIVGIVGLVTIGATYMYTREQ